MPGSPLLKSDLGLDFLVLSWALSTSRAHPGACLLLPVFSPGTLLCSVSKVTVPRVRPSRLNVFAARLQFCTLCSLCLATQMVKCKCKPQRKCKWCCIQMSSPGYGHPASALRTRPSGKMKHFFPHQYIWKQLNASNTLISDEISMWTEHTIRVPLFQMPPPWTKGLKVKSKALENVIKVKWLFICSSVHLLWDLLKWQLQSEAN